MRGTSLQLRTSILNLPKLKKSLSSSRNSYLRTISEEISEFFDIRKLIEKSIIDSPPITLKEGGIIKDGYHK